MSHGVDMLMSLAYAVSLAEARSCLAALADTAPDFDESVLYEHLLLDLDAWHGDNRPPLGPRLAERNGLLDRLEAAVDRMIELGGCSLALELLLAGAGVW